METPSVNKCVSCSNTYSGNYCNQCGEKTPHASDISLLSYLAQLFNEFTSADSRFWLTLKTIILTPGQLSKDQIVGKRIVYMRPITLFFVCNLIYFVFPLFETFNTSLQSQINMPYSEIIGVKDRIDVKTQDLKISEEIFVVTYEQASSENSKLMLILMIPLLMPFFALIGFTKRAHWANHANIAIEYSIFFLGFNTIFLGYIFYAFARLLELLKLPISWLNEFNLSLAIVISSYLFLTAAAKRFYELTSKQAYLAGLVIVIGNIIALFVYRFVLFEITMLRL